jgi:eukaryotic-like serine/threonine-protein kinase
MDPRLLDTVATIVRPRVGARARTPPRAPAGERIARRYRVLGRIATGGTAEVIAAEDRELGRSVAIKRPRDDSDPGVSTLAREARVLARLRHPGIVVLHDHVIDRGRDHLVLEHIPGGTLARLRGALTPAAVARIGARIADALAHVHARGVIHLDLKAENVLLDGEAPRLIDFGIAECAALPPGPAVGTLGTPRAMAPEQILAGRVDARTDLFALGVLLHELLAGASPFAADSVEATLRRVLEGTPAALPGCGALADLVQHLLEKEPALRPQSADEVAARLADIAAGGVGHPRCRSCVAPGHQPGAGHRCSPG